LETILAKGIRVNQLAKELDVPSKDILEKCRAEGLGDRVTNHMSVLSIGLAETVREWFTPGMGGTAVEVAAPVDVAVKPKTRARRKKVEEAPDERPEQDEQPRRRQVPFRQPPRRPSSEEPAPQAPEAPEVEVQEEWPIEEPAAPPVEAEVQPEPVGESAVMQPPIEEPPTITETLPEVPAPTEPEPMRPAAEVQPAAEAPPVFPAGAPQAPDQAGRPGPRPTVTLTSRHNAPAVIERKVVIPAPRLETPAPAKIQGPRVVRQEAPDHVAPPRPKRAPGRTESGGAVFTPARPQGGRGVKVDDDEEAARKKAAAKGRSSLSSRRRGADGRRGEAMEKLKEYTEADLLERRDRLASATSYRTGFEGHLKKRSERGQHFQARTAAQTGEPVAIEEPVTVKSLSAALGIKSNDIISRLMRQGVFATVNQSIDREVAEMVALEYGVELRIKEQQTLEEQLQQEFEERQQDTQNVVQRPPVVTILGHVDHGKTSLLDRIRNANVAAGEAGGITQHTAAWMVEVKRGDDTKRVTFIDTPGHQAFTAMRARGANMTDVVVLVVSAAEGVQPQTVESINHARAAGVPIIVALNKIDRPDANPDMVLGQLAAQNLNPSEWGGDTEVVRTSAITGQGIEELIEILDYQSELLELKADPTAAARGVVIESNVDEGLGPVATVLVQEGTLRVGDVLLSGPGYGRIRSLLNDRRQPVQEAGPATPVIVSGLDVLPSAGDKFFVLDDIERARSIAEERQSLSRQQQLSDRNRVTLDNLFAQIKAGEVKEIRLIIKGDVQGSVETLAGSVTDANTEEVKVRVIHTAVGGITESDVELADASDAVIIGFHVVPDEAARQMAEQRRVEIRLYRVIYEIFDDLKKALSGLLEPEIREKLHGHAEIRQVFKVSRIGNIAGCLVTDGHIQRGSRLRLIRNGTVITEDLSLESLKRLKDDVREVKSGLECGIKVAGYDDIKVGDVFEAYIRETIQRTL
jgi:translation initiation factor IF-2